MFRRSKLHKSVDDYLDYLRVLRSMHYLQEKPSWSVAACAQQAGFSVVRTFNRKFQDALGMTPHEFRMLLESGRENIK
jgi:transcriptional regulator GlxA family with amidase domain